MAPTSFRYICSVDAALDAHLAGCSSSVSLHFCSYAAADWVDSRLARHSIALLVPLAALKGKGATALGSHGAKIPTKSQKIGQSYRQIDSVSAKQIASIVVKPPELSTMPGRQLQGLFRAERAALVLRLPWWIRFQEEGQTAETSQNPMPLQNDMRVKTEESLIERPPLGQDIEE